MLDSSARRLTPRDLAGALALALLLTGCADDEESAPKASPTPITRLNTTAMDVPRIEFCPLVPKDAVSAALDGEPDSDAAYGNGDEEKLPGIGADAVHELGCTWTRDDGTAARAWIFARPVTAEFARTVIASGSTSKGCQVAEGPVFGKPSSTQVCRVAGSEQRVRHAGLFGQTWLTCEISSKQDDTARLRSRTDRWCVEVLNAVNTAQ